MSWGHRTLMGFLCCSMALMGLRNGIVIAGIAALGGLW